MQANLSKTAVARPARITGERAMSNAGGFNPAWQRHVAEYAEAARLVGEGPVLDLGCGVGHSNHLFGDRDSVGVDVDSKALEGQDRPTLVADMRRLPLADGEFPSVVSIHSVEHVPDPERVVAEVARVLAADGVAFFVTPNRLTFGLPDEVIDPFHWIEFDPEQLRALCLARFETVELRGLFASAAYMQLFEEERAAMRKRLALDPLRLRRVLPRRARQALYDLALRRLRREDDPRAAAITIDDFEFRDTGLEAALDLCAVCRDPRR
jgi:SAM-dependent methyltransferase